MALDVNKIRKTQVSTTPTTHNTDAGSTALVVSLLILQIQMFKILIITLKLSII